MASEANVADLLEKLLETTQDLFIFQALGSGCTIDQIRTLLRVDQRRVIRVSKIRGKRAEKAKAR